MKPRDTLDALLKLKQERVETKARELGQQQSKRSRAEAELVATRRKRHEHEATLTAVATEEESLLRNGTLKVHDLATQGAWREKSTLQAAALHETERERLASLRAADVAVSKARTELAERRADTKALERHRDETARESLREKELDEEEAGLENHAARKAREH